MASGPQSDKNEAKSRSSMVLAILLVFAVIAIGAFFVLRPGPRQVVVNRPTPMVSSRELIDGATSFLRSLQDKQDFYGYYNCDETGQCHLAEKNHVGAAAWNILSGLSMLNLGRNDLGMELVNYFADQWTKHVDDWTEIYSVHQLFEAYDQLKDRKYMVYVWTKNAPVLGAAQHIFMNPEVPDKDKLAMLSATIARELAQLAYILGDDASVKYLTSLDQFPNGAEEVKRKREEYIDTSQELIMLTTSYAEREGPPLIKNGPAQTECWAPWARFMLYRATKDQSQLDTVIDFLRKANFHKRDPKTLYVATLQSVIPCLDLLITLQDKDPAFKEDFRFLMENAVIPNWDSPSHKICHGDGGFITTLRPSDPDRSHVCLNNTKSVSDNSWLSFILSKVPAEKFKLL